jgi:hypothetical protein
VDDFNPYAAPEVGVSRSPLANVADEGRGVWRDGNILVMAKVARLPSRCVKCNEPTTNRLKRSLAWHPGWVYLLILVSPLIFIIVALIIRKTAKIEIPLCDEHRANRSRNILIAWLTALSGIALCFTPAFLNAQALSNGPLPGILIFLGVILLFFGLIFGAIISQFVVPQKIDDTHVWLKKVSPLYLAELPLLPGSEGWEMEGKPKPKLQLDEL